MYAKTLLALAASTGLASAAGAIQGFNYGSNKPDGSAHVKQDFVDMFTQAKAVAGTNGAFNSARLYTMIQGGSQADPIEAIEAAVQTKTHLLLGMWASAGQQTITNELAALKAAISAHGSDLADLVDGISVGSEDLYRITPTSQTHDPGLVGAGPSDIVNYIGQLKKALANTPLAGAKIGHVDTWTAWVNGSNSAVVDACDWIGMDAYPYFENQKENKIENSKGLFDSAWQQTQSASKGKPVWITETGWPTAGKTEGQGVPSTESAQQYWEAVGCGELFGKYNTWWFTYYDGAPNPTFGLVDSVGGKPKYDLSCSKKSNLGDGIYGSGSSSSSGSSSGGNSTSSGSTSSPSDGASSGNSSSSSGGSAGGSTSQGGNTTAPSPSSPSGSSSGGSSGGSSGSSGSASTGAASTNGACFLGLIGAAVAAVALF